MGRRQQRVEVSGEHLIHRHLWNGARLLKLGDERRPGWLYPYLGATLFVHFALEAFLNFVGEQITPEVWEDERHSFDGRSRYRGTTGKLDFLLTHLDLHYPKGKRPRSTITLLDRMRDGVVRSPRAV